ncbi:hypothetical protein N9S96_00195 [Flavobacteriales bacterium]|nr:hypothetical protein [Flavobacteriales bacterium]
MQRNIISLLLFLFIMTMSFTDVFILENEYIRPYTLCCFCLIFVIFTTKLKVKKHIITLLFFITLFLIFNLLTPFVIAPNKHLRYIAAFIGVALFHFIIISQSLQKIEVAKAQKYILYSISFVCILAVTEFLINVFFQEFSYPFRANKANAVIFFKRSYAFATEPSTLGAFIVSLLPLVDIRKYSNRQLMCFYVLVTSAIVSTLSIYVIIIFILYSFYQINYRYILLLLFIMLIGWNFIPNEIVTAFSNKLFFEGASGSSIERLDHLTRSIDESFNNIFFGMGWGAETQIIYSSSHNFFIGVLVSNGIIGVLFLALFLLMTFFRYPPFKSSLNKKSWECIILSGFFLLTSSSFYEPSYLFGLAFLTAYGHIRGENV